MSDRCPLGYLFFQLCCEVISYSFYFSGTMSGDSRKDFILTTTANYFAVQVTDGSIQSLLNSPALNSFLDDGNATVLAGRFEMKGGRAKGFTFSNKVG